MRRNGLIVGAIALLLVLVARQEAVTSLVRAQNGTPTATTDADATRTQAYDDFLAKLAANVGVADPAQVDIAIRTALKQMVDERQAAGELTAEESTALKERIDAAAVPLRSAVGRDHGFHDGRWDRGRDGDHDRSPQDGRSERQEPLVEATPTL